MASRPNKGQPRPNWGVYLTQERFKADREGRFRIRALWPDYEFRRSDEDGDLPVGDGLRLGETKDLGDVRMKREGP